MYVQDREEAWEASAARVSGSVADVNEDEQTLWVMLDGRSGAVLVPVEDTGGFDFGAWYDFYVAEDQVRPVTQPYDATFWVTFAAFALALGLAAGVRGALPNLAVRRLLRRPQPWRSVTVRCAYDEVFVYSLDASDGDEPLLTIPVRVPPDEDWAVPQPATLVGDPAAGSWAAVVLRGVTLVPAGPARDGADGPPAGDLTATTDDEFDP